MSADEFSDSQHDIDAVNDDHHGSLECVWDTLPLPVEEPTVNFLGDSLNPNDRPGCKLLELLRSRSSITPLGPAFLQCSLISTMDPLPPLHNYLHSLKADRMKRTQFILQSEQIRMLPSISEASSPIGVVKIVTETTHSPIEDNASPLAMLLENSTILKRFTSRIIIIAIKCMK